jgi:pimeloyl-ACP methyl ester carboxylesterase/heme-degrading monooxygenase HmoA
MSSYVHIDGWKIFITRDPGSAPPSASPVVFVHGGSFPSALAVEWSFGDGTTWAENLAAAGHDLWAFDFVGFGQSDRFPEMSSAPAPGALGRADVAARQLSGVVDHVRNVTGKKRVALLAHSWGGLVACRFATEWPDAVERLVLFGPILRRERSDVPDPSAFAGWTLLTRAAQRRRFIEDVPAGEPPLVTDDMFERWADGYLATDARSAERAPHAVAIPTGPQADIAAAWRGEIPYDPACIDCSVHVVRGEWDSLCNDEDVAAFRASLTACPSFQDAKLERGTHLMHLESGRTRLWSAVRNALTAALHTPVNTHCVLFEVRPTSEGRDVYLGMAAKLRPLLDEVDGFLTIDRLASRRRPGWILSLQTWTDDAAIAAWRSRDRHHFAQELGRTLAFEDYRLRVGRLVHDDRLDAHEQPRGRSTYVDALRPSRHVGILEVLGSMDAALEGEVFDSLYTPGKVVCVVELDTRADADAWASRARDVAATMRSAGTVCHVRLVETIRDYGMFDRAEAPSHHPPVARRGG